MTKKPPPWTGHRRATAAALLSIMERAMLRQPGISRDDRALYIACEFWAASMHGGLREHLGTASQLCLSNAELAFSRLGMPDIALALQNARLQLTDASRAQSLARVAKEIELSLATSDHNVDQQFARFARSQCRVGASA